VSRGHGERGEDVRTPPRRSSPEFRFDLRRPARRVLSTPTEHQRAKITNITVATADPTTVTSAVKNVRINMGRARSQTMDCFGVQFDRLYPSDWLLLCGLLSWSQGS
jgi:hypothetical protein